MLTLEGDATLCTPLSAHKMENAACSCLCDGCFLWTLAGCARKTFGVNLGPSCLQTLGDLGSQPAGSPAEGFFFIECLLFSQTISNPVN